MRKNLLRDKRAEDEAKIYRESLSVHKVLDKELGFDKQAIEVFTRSLNIKKKVVIHIVINLRKEIKKLCNPQMYS